MELSASTKGRFGFVRRGNFIAMPLEFPSVSEAIPPDDSYIVSLARPVGGIVFGCTGGHNTHVFAAAVKPPGGYVVDLGIAEDVASPQKIVLMQGEEKRGPLLLAGADESGGGILVKMRATGWTDGVQEWNFKLPTLRPVLQLTDEPIMDVMPGLASEEAFVLTSARLLRVDVVLGEVQEECATPGKGGQQLLCVGTTVAVGCPDGELYSVTNSPLAVQQWTSVNNCVSPLTFQSARLPDTLLGADAEGKIFMLPEGHTEPVFLGDAPMAPVKCIEALKDGRVFGMCGQGMGRFFQTSVSHVAAEDLGAVLAVHGAKRYAHSFSCAVAGEDGEIYLGEDDRRGHFWIYFPFY